MDSISITEKNKSKKGYRFDGTHEIPFLKRQKTVKNGKRRTKGEDGTEKATTSKEQDDFVLKSLLKNCGVNSAIGHDQIIASCSVPDIDLVEAEATAVAKRAAEILRRSQK